MARLRGAPLPRPKRRDDTPSDDQDHESDVQPLERVPAAPSPTRQSLTIEVQSKLDVEQVFNGTDLTKFLATSDVDEALDLGQKIIIKRSQMVEAVNSQCAWDISMVWRSIDKLGKERPDKLALINKWQEDVGRQLESDSNEITYYLQLAEKTLLRLSAYGKRIYNSWGVLPTQVLPKEQYDTERPLSKSLLQQMAKLTEYVSREEGQQLLSDSIQRRNHKDTRALYQRRYPYLVHGDLRAVIETQETKKRGRVEEEDDEDGTDVRAESRSIKRQKRLAIKKDAEEEEAEEEEEEKEKEEDDHDNDDHGNDGGDDDENETDAKLRVPLTGGDTQSTPRSHSSSLSHALVIVSNGEAAEGNTEPGPSPIVTGGEAMDDKDEQESSCASIELPRRAPPMPRYQSPTPPHLIGQTMHETGPKHADLRSSPGHVAHGAGAVQGVATNDLNMVLATLHPGHKLSSTAIQQALAFCVPADSYVIDPLYFNSDFSDRSSLSRRLAKSVQRILIPLHDRQLSHWTLAVLNLEHSSISIYDSLGRKQTSDPSLAQRLQKFAMGVVDRPQQQWTLRSADCPKQSNGTDCGVYVVANALFIMTNNDLPQTYDCSAWRLVCRAMIGESIQDIRLDSLERFRSPEKIRNLEEAAGVHPFQLQNPGESSLATGLREIKQLTQGNLVQVQAQQRKLRTLCDSAVAITNVLEAVRRRLATETLFLSDQLLKNQQLLAEHAAFLQRHDIRPDGGSSGQDDFSIMQASQGDQEDLLATMRATQTSMTRQLEKKAMKKKALYDEMLKSKSLVTLAKQIHARYEGELDLSDSAERQIRGTAQKWRDIIADALSGLDETLAS